MKFRNRIVVFLILTMLLVGGALVPAGAEDTAAIMKRLASQFGLTPRSELPLLMDIKSDVTIERIQDGFRYKYAFSSSPANKGECVILRLSISKDNPDSIVATEIVSSALSWESHIDNGDVSWWCSDNCTNRFLPGVRVDGFTIRVGGIPGIKNFVAAPYVEVEKFYPSVDEISETEADVVVELARHDQLRDVRFFGKTLGPLPEPTDLAIVCDTFVLDLIGQVREAATLGWIKHDLRKDDDKSGKGKGDEKGVKKGDDDADDHADDDVEMDNKDKGLPGVAKSIIKKLTKVRRECLRGKFGSAREKLRALIKQVNAQRGKHLTEESYALIKFNAEFLLEKF